MSGPLDKMADSSAGVVMPGGGADSIVSREYPFGWRRGAGARDLVEGCDLTVAAGPLPDSSAARRASMSVDQLGYMSSGIAH